ncbi:DNA polymerase I [Rhodovibrionaceae bacterium A322]
MTAPQASAPKHLYLIDGSGYIFRAYFAVRVPANSKGVPVNATFGFTSMLMKLLKTNEADGIAVVFDAKGKTFRNDIYADYKANRPPAPEDLVPQFASVREATRAFNLPCIEMTGYEADDIIATLAEQGRAAGCQVTVVSSDKDLMQLVTDGVDMLDPMKEKAIGPAEVFEKFGVTPEQVVEVQALAGDSVDNVPGVPGIGLKTAAQLITEYGGLEELLTRAGEIKQPKRREKLIENADLARISLDLVTLKKDVPLDLDLADLTRKEPDPATVYDFMDEYEFRTLKKRATEWLDGDGATADVAAQTPGSAEPSYELVQDEDALKRWIAEANQEGVVAVDTETTGLNVQRVDLVGISLGLKNARACYIPLAHVSPNAEAGGLALAGPADAPKQIDRDRALGLLKPLLEDPAVLKIGQNMKYDARIFARAAFKDDQGQAISGIQVAPFDDTMLLSYVLEGGLHGHGMDELAELHLDRKPIPFKEVCGSGKNQITFDKVPLDKARDYAAEDAEITYALWETLKPQLVPRKMTTVYETLERPLVPVLAAMEAEGIKADRDELRRLSNDFATRIEELAGQIHQLAGREFTIGSPKQLGEILFDELGLPGGKKGKSGAYATGADVLEGLANQGHELPQKVLDWRQLAKLKSTYTDALQEAIDPQTGRIHTSYSQAVAATGRLSSNDPNLQNIPVRTEEGRKIRSAFVAEEGCKLLSVDYSQIELRLTAHIAEVKELQEAFADGADIHAMTASQVFGVPMEDMDPMVRRQAKAINFGIIYGISAFGLAQNLGIAQKEAKEYIEAYFARFPGIRTYMDAMKSQGKEQGFVTTLFGRRIHVPALLDKNPMRRGFGERAAINAPIQGTAADIIKRAMIQIPGALTSANLKAKMLLQVHDELIFEVPEAELEETSALVRGVMENACNPVVELSVDLVADAGIGDTWNDAH